MVEKELERWLFQATKLASPQSIHITEDILKLDGSFINNEKVDLHAEFNIQEQFAWDPAPTNVNPDRSMILKSMSAFLPLNGIMLLLLMIWSQPHSMPMAKVSVGQSMTFTKLFRIQRRFQTTEASLLLHRNSRSVVG